MKKIIVVAIAVASVVAMGACSRNRCTCDKGDGGRVYTGVLPAADVVGVRTTLWLDYDGGHGSSGGDYRLLETYLTGDSLSVTGYRDIGSYLSAGRFSVMRETGSEDGRSYIKLKGYSKGVNDDAVYFLVRSDSTIEMVDASLRPSQNSGLNYVLTLAK